MDGSLPRCGNLNNEKEGYRSAEFVTTFIHCGNTSSPKRMAVLDAKCTR